MTISQLRPERIRTALEPYGFVPDDAVCAHIRDYIAHLLKWNQKVNLTSITDPREILERHFGESLFALREIPPSAATLLDVGSGAGFPGLVIKMVRPTLQVTLLEPVLRKTAFLKETARLLTVSVQIVASRLEEHAASEPVDCVTSRAVRISEDLAGPMARQTAPGGRILIWGTEGSEIPNVAGIAWHSVRMPKSDRRTLIVGIKA